MAHFLVVSDETDSVVAEGGVLLDVLEKVADLGYCSGYVTNQDGGREDLAEALTSRDLHAFFGPTTRGWLTGEPSRPCLVDGCRVREFYVEDEEGAE